MNAYTSNSEVFSELSSVLSTAHDLVNQCKKTPMNVTQKQLVSEAISYRANNGLRTIMKYGDAVTGKGVDPEVYASYVDGIITRAEYLRYWLEATGEKTFIAGERNTALSLLFQLEDLERKLRSIHSPTSCFFHGHLMGL